MIHYIHIFAPIPLILLGLVGLAALYRFVTAPANRCSLSSAEMETIMATIPEAATAIESGATALNAAATALTTAAAAIATATNTDALTQPLADLATAVTAVQTAATAVENAVSPPHAAG